MASDFLEDCARLTDFELCSAINVAAESRFDEDWVELTPWQLQVVYGLWTFQGFAEGEGFDDAVSNLYFYDGPAKILAQAYEIIGLTGPAEALWNLSKLFLLAEGANRESNSESHLFQSGEDFLTFLEGKSDWEKIEAEFRSGQDEFVARLAEFVRKNLGEISDLKLDAARIVRERELPGVGFLPSFHFWMHTFADEHDGRIPSLPELQAFCSHDGLKKSSEDSHEILIQGQMSDYGDDTPIVRYRREVFGQTFVLLKSGQVISKLKE